MPTAAISEQQGRSEVEVGRRCGPTALKYLESQSRERQRYSTVPTYYNFLGQLGYSSSQLLCHSRKVQEVGCRQGSMVLCTSTYYTYPIYILSTYIVDTAEVGKY